MTQGVTPAEGTRNIPRHEAKSDLHFKLYAPREGHPDWSAINQKAQELADEILSVIEVDSGSVSEKLSEAARITHALSTVAKSQTTNYFRMKKGNHTLIPLYFIWTMLNTCNFRCVYCDNHSGEKYFNLPNKNMLDTEQGKRLLEIVRKNTTGVYFCGGEPTLRKDLPELAEYAKSALHYFPLMINTNGSRLHVMLTDARYRRFLKNMDVIIVSLDALNVSTLNNVWGVKNENCEQVLVNILALRKLQKKVRFKLMVNTVITPETLDEADAILDWANDLGIWYSPVPMNEGQCIHAGFEASAKYQALREKIMERKSQGYKILGSKKLIGGLLYGREIKCFPSLIPHVDPDGGKYWPCKTKSNVERFKINMLDYDSLDAAYQAGARKLSVDIIHGDGPGQCGGNCNWMQNYAGDALARALQSPFKSGVLSEMMEFAGRV